MAHFRYFSLLVPLYGHLDVGILSYQIALHISICLFKPNWLYRTFLTFEIHTWLNFGKAASYFFMKISPWSILLIFRVTLIPYTLLLQTK